MVALYDTLSAHYDRFVNWEARLAHELPFLLAVLELERAGAARVLDVACGTGQHAIALAQRGYQVTGTDLSAPMIEQARRNATAVDAPVRFLVAGFGEQAQVAGTGYDAVLCLGNGLPHVLTADDLRATLADFAAVLPSPAWVGRPGGVLVLQVRNYARIMACRERFIGPQGDEGQSFVRFHDFDAPGPGLITFNMVVLTRRDDGWDQRVESTVLRPVFRDELAGLLAEAGFSDAAFYGGLDGSTWDPAASEDLVVVARRSAG
ncbi:MAG: methyltransferase domain-containing protein [Chloroflexi bacterium]|nr:methyltransferase domain-containing protein [Chloroflexota bacterium]MBU1877643.1 methyltransferase domain-containing protein [Chloroflexota bacterium]